jgi:hypothetical protein
MQKIEKIFAKAFNDSWMLWASVASSSVQLSKELNAWASVLSSSVKLSKELCFKSKIEFKE